MLPSVTIWPLTSPLETMPPSRAEPTATPMSPWAATTPLMPWTWTWLMRRPRLMIWPLKRPEAWMTVAVGPVTPLLVATYTLPRSALPADTTLVMGSVWRPVVWMVPVIPPEVVIEPKMLGAVMLVMPW